MELTITTRTLLFGAIETLERECLDIDKVLKSSSYDPDFKQMKEIEWDVKKDSIARYKRILFENFFEYNN